ncbi:hypothetical protein [Lacisediminihabitans profunda]|uniref:Uncharacterized protein n=1 Tax=Lacisediminihabitans profunda TaxID=2594790 RepID=A0A5C8UR55_9MICO|nr:hypothetical protein [Lacisediminihabitans profunda]TXN30430.1 hypothetical protein FVP33_10580 [Lacisediminihabitans profunda]
MLTGILGSAAISHGRVVSGVYDQREDGATGSDSDSDVDSHIAYAIHAGNPAATSVFHWIPHASECRVAQWVATDAAGNR